MTRNGEIVPEIAAILRDIAVQIEAGTAGDRQITILRNIAESAEGKTGDFVLKLHRRSGRASGGYSGVNRRLAMARAIKDYRDKHGGPLDSAYQTLNGSFSVGAETLRKAWQEFGPMLEMDDVSQKLFLRIKQLEAKGLCRVTRVKKPR